MSYAAVRSALRTKLLGYPGLPEVAFEGRIYERVTGTPYLRETMKPANSQRINLDSEALVRHTGLYLLDLFIPPTGVLSEEDSLADGLVEHFWPGLQVSSNGVAVIIRKSVRGGTLPGTDWRQIPITITFIFDTLNP